MQRDSREAQVALELQRDGLILCYGSLGASHPLCKCGLGSCKGSCSARECADILHDSQEVSGGEGNVLLGQCESAWPSYI